MERDTDRMLHQKVTRHRKIADKSTRYASETAGEMIRRRVDCNWTLYVLFIRGGKRQERGKERGASQIDEIHDLRSSNVQAPKKASRKCYIRIVIRESIQFKKI
jgi:hypothetical protein